MMLIMNFYDVISVFSDLYRELYDKLFTDHYDSEATPKLSRHTTFLPVHLGICRKEGLFGREHQVIARVKFMPLLFSVLLVSRYFFPERTINCHFLNRKMSFRGSYNIHHSYNFPVHVYRSR